MFMLFGRTFAGRGNDPYNCPDEDDVYISDLYKRYQALLFQKAALYTNNLQAQEDIAQNTVLRLICNVDRLRTLDPPALTTYIALTVRSAALNYLRDERRDSLGALPLDEELEEEYIPLDGSVQLTLEEQMLQGHQDDKVRAAVGRLSKRDQIALTGKYFLGLDNQDLAEFLSVTPGTLRTVLCRARGRILEELKKEGILYG